METKFTSKELWVNQAPSFNFELDEDQILAKALESGFVSKVGDDQYLVNEKYKKPQILSGKSDL